MLEEFKYKHGTPGTPGTCISLTLPYQYNVIS